MTRHIYAISVIILAISFCGCGGSGGGGGSSVANLQLTSITPDHGPYTGGTTVTITGSNFVNGTNLAVEFGSGNLATATVFHNASAISCLTPAGYGTVTVFVTNGDGGVENQSDGFTYTWGEPTNVSTSTHDSCNPDIAVDSDGFAHIVYNHSSQSKVYYYDSATGNNTEIAPGYNPRVAASIDNSVYVAWGCSSNVYVASSDNWSDITDLGEGGYPDITAAPDGTVYVVYYNQHVNWSPQNGNYYWYDLFLANSSAGFQNPILLTNSSWSPVYQAVTADYAGTLHVAWVDSQGSTNMLKYINSSDWTATLENVTQINNPVLPSIVVDDYDTVHLAFRAISENDSAYYGYYTNSINWDNERVQLTGQYGGTPALVLDNAGTVHAFWHETFQIWHAESTNWSNTAAIVACTDDESYYPQVDISSTNEIHIVWEEEISGDYDEIYYLKYAP